MQNQERILSVIDVRGRKFDIPVDRIIEANNAFLDKAMVVEEESTVSKSRSCPPRAPLSAPSAPTSSPQSSTSVDSCRLVTIGS